jgi:hypothetical protein
LAYSADINHLMSVSLNHRDIEWEQSFLQALPSAKLEVLNESPVAGPDGWPYLLAKSDVNSSEPATRVLEWLSERGIGLVINPDKMAPDYVLTYGMIWNFRERGEFLSRREQGSAALSAKSSGAGEATEADVTEFEIEAGAKLHTGDASREYLPDYARHVLRAFFTDNGTPNVKILVVGERDKSNYSLCFSLESLGNPGAAEHKGVLEAISWFLPPHYSIAILSEQGMPKFYDL